MANAISYLKYRKPLRASLILKVGTTGFNFSISDEIITNSEEALWEFLNSWQNKLDQRPAKMQDEWGDWEETEKLICWEAMGTLYEEQEKLYESEIEYVRWELTEIGVYGYIFLASSEYMEEILKTYFEGSLLHNNNNQIME